MKRNEQEKNEEKRGVVQTKTTKLLKIPIEWDFLLQM